MAVPEFISTLRDIRDVKYPEIVTKHDLVVAKEALMNPHYTAIDVVNSNISAVTAVYLNEANITAVNANKTNIDLNATNIVAIQGASTNALIASTKASEASASAQEALDYLSQISGLNAIAVTLQSSASATADYNPATGVLTLGIPQGLKGDTGEAFDIDASGLIAERSNYDSALQGFSFLSLDEDPTKVYFKKSDTPGDWTVGVPFGKGDTGDTGVGIVSVTFTSTTDSSGLAGKAGATDTYTITFSDASTTTFDITNGSSSTEVTAKSTVLAGLLSISNVVSIVSDADPFLDGSQVFKWELDGNANDTDGVTPINGTPTNVTWDYKNQKFGTAQAVFDGSAYILGTSSINSNIFTYKMVVTPDTVDAVTTKSLIDFATGRGILANGVNQELVTDNLAYFNGATWYDLGYKLTVGKQETVELYVNNTLAYLYIDGLLKSTTTVVSTSIDGVFSVGSNNAGNANFYVGKLDQVEVYTGVRASTDHEALHFQEITRGDNTLSSTGLEISYANGINNGAVNFIEQVVDGAKTISGLTASSLNYIYKEKDNATLGATTVEPVWGLNNKRTSAVNPDVFDKGKWWNSTNGDEKVVNGTFDTDTDWTKGTGWSIAGGKASCDGTQVASSNLVPSAYGTYELGVKYTCKFKVTDYSAGTIDVLIYDGITNLTERASNISSIGEYSFEFVATSTSLRPYIGADANFIGSVDEISVFESNILPDTAYTTPRTYLTDANGLGIVETDSSGNPSVLHEWKPVTLLEEHIRTNKFDVFVVDDNYVDLYAVGANPTAKLYNDGTVIGSTDNGSYEYNLYTKKAKVSYLSISTLSTGEVINLPLELNISTAKLENHGSSNRITSLTSVTNLSVTARVTDDSGSFTTLTGWGISIEGDLV